MATAVLLSWALIVVIVNNRMGGPRRMRRRRPPPLNAMWTVPNTIHLNGFPRSPLAA